MGFELEWSLVETSLEGVCVTSHEERVPGAPLKDSNIKRVRGAHPGTKIKVVMSKVVFNGPLTHYILNS